MSLVIAIDGACRRNGKPNCLAAGGALIQQFREEQLVGTATLSNYEIGSTNQRGELLALLAALDYIWSAKQDTQIITDSEYLFNTMTKEWYISWEKKGWVTSLDEPVKNKDMWQAIAHAFNKCASWDLDIAFYHIKGHSLPFGKVTAASLLQQDTSGASMYAEALLKYDKVCETTQKDKLEVANDLSEKNNGFRLNEETLRRFVVANTVADAIATKCVEAADQLMV